MVRRFAHVSLAIFLVLALASLASAAPNVVNTTQKGSLLVFPKVVHETGVKTYFFIGNDQAEQVYVKCYWMSDNQTVEDFHFRVTANQPIIFDTETNAYGPPFEPNYAGTLTCWAANPADTAPVKFNHLYGYAMIAGTTVDVFYNAHSFAVRNAGFYTVIADGQVQLNLDALNGYDGCPKYLVTNFVPFGSTLLGAGNNPDLTLWPCKQDLRQDRIPTCTKAKFDVWNWNEVKFTGAYQCFKCFFEGFLEDIGNPASFIYKRGKGFGYDKFDYTKLGSKDIARMRVQGVKSTVCDGNTGIPSESYICPSTEATPLLGLMLYGTPLGNTIDPVAGYTMHGAGYDQTGFIKYDVAGDVPEAPRQ